MPAPVLVIRGRRRSVLLTPSFSPPGRVPWVRVIQAPLSAPLTTASPRRPVVFRPGPVPPGRVRWAQVVIPTRPPRPAFWSRLRLPLVYTPPPPVVFVPSARIWADDSRGLIWPESSRLADLAEENRTLTFS